MSALRVPALRYTLGRNGPILHSSQRRWAQVHDVRFVATHREPDRVLEKYKEKLDRKAKEQGLRDAHELKEAYRATIRDQRKNASIAETSQLAATSTIPSPSSTTSPFPHPPPPPQPITTSPLTTTTTPNSNHPQGVKPLSSYISIPKTRTLPPPEIAQIWRLRHASSPTSLCATIPSTTYTRIERTARRHPQFILPLPRPGQGAEIHFLQWTFPSPTTATVLFTHLAEYKLRGEYATPHTTVTHHLDLAGEKGLVLMEGNVVEGRGVSVEEGRWLVMCLQKFYAEGSGAGEGGVVVGGGEEKERVARGKERGVRKKLLEQFSQGDGGFRIEELLEEAEKI